MFSKHVGLLCFLLTLPSFHGRPDGQRLQVDNSLRGNSFGLENFLFQPYENAEVKDVVRIPKPKRVRPTVNSRVNNDRGQTYGLENLSAQLYESSRIKPPATVKPTQEYPKRRPVEPTAEANKIRENFVATPVPEVTQEPPQTSTQTAERIRKRIMMRRRRKRPSNGAQSDGNSEITGNAILQPLRIPVYPQVPKVSIRTKLPDSTNPRREKEHEEEITEQEITTVTEKSTTSTPKPTTTTTEKPSTINLKTFLKLQTETLSLSELLQTQNLSLADLLRGNKDASAILKVRQTVTSTTPATSTRRKQFNRVEVDKIKPQKTEVVEVTSSRPNYNGFQPKIPRTKTSESVKPVEEYQEDNKRQDDHNKRQEDYNKRQQDDIKPIKRPAYSTDTAYDPQNRLNELRSKLRNFQKKTTAPEVTSESVPAIESVSGTPKTTEVPLYKKNRVSFKSTNNPDLSLILPSKPKPELESPKRPERLSNWTSRLPSLKRFGQDRLKPNELQKKPLRVPILVEDSSEEEVVETTTKVEEVTEEEVRKPEAKDELIELLKSGQNADRLQKILNSRNMTIQELLDNREKPPLQMDISTLFSNQQKPTSTQPTLFDSLPDFQLEETDSPAYEEQEAEESAPSIARVELMPSREPKQYELPVSEKGVSDLNLQPDDLTADTANSEDSTLWKLSEKSIFYGSSYGYGDFPAVQHTEKPKTVKTTELSDSDIILLETIRRNQETNRKFKLDLTDFVREEEPETEDIEKSYIPPAVKSAIIASGVVMGIALFVFIAIFAACGWKQRQIRLKGNSSVLGGTLGRSEKSKRTLSPVSFKDTHSYKKTLDFDEETSESGSSNTSSYLWSTLKNTFTSRASTLKSRLEKEEKVREDKVTLRRNESRRKESDRPNSDEVYAVKKIDRDRNVINTSFNFKRSQSNSSVNHFNECVHGY